MRFLITSHGHLTGVRLSLLGSFGNVPFDDDAAAAKAAEELANGDRFTIERASYPALPPYRGALPHG